MILEVRIKAAPGGTSRALRFTKSPIRIGRNQLNDISLEDPFVSEWHGTIRFDEQSVAYFDLGSTNGTQLDGKRLSKNVAINLSESSVLRLGLLELSVSRPAAEPSRPAFDSSAPTPPPMSPLAPVSPAAAPAGGVHQTLAWGYRAMPGDPKLTGRSANAVTPPPVSTPTRDARPKNDITGRAQAAAAPAPAPLPLTDPVHRDVAADVAARHEKLLEAFTESFIGLRKGYEQFGREVGVRTINGSTPLHRAASRRELLDYLLQPNLDPAATARDLIAIFADFGIHHIAMMQGVTEGVRAMLQSLSPQANDIDAGGRLFAGAKAKGLWKAYLDRFDQMITDDNELHAAIFGNDFARAYSSVTIGEGHKPHKEDKD